MSLYVNADNVKTIDISFDVKDFNMTHNESGLLEISSTKHSVSYGEDVTEPGLPLVGMKVAIPKESEFESLSVKGSKNILQSNVLLATNPLAVPTNAVSHSSSLSVPDYMDKVYPSNTVEYVSTNVMDGYKMICFLVSPFEYDAAKGELSFYQKITMQINLTNGKSISTGSSPFVGKNAKDLIRQMVINPEDVEDPAPSGDTPKTMTSLSPTSPVDYLIITSDSLLSSFDDLVTWKKTKGVRTEVISLDSIDHNYSDSTIQLKIKMCLYDYYLNRGLKYVLLGGDNTIVPVRYCHAEVTTSDGPLITDMPSDLYYACMGGNFEWDGNGNDIYGEFGDNIDFSPSIYISRLPIQTQEHVAAYLSKLLCYERDPLSKPWKDNILMCGVKTSEYSVGTKSDSEAKGDLLYGSAILPYWSGNRVKFYDTYTDFPGGAGYHVSKENFQDQLQQGYTFVELGTHSVDNNIDMENSTGYLDSHASILQNEGFTIFSTVACLTNAFDSSHPAYPDPCISEAFIRNPNSGIIAYLGCSRESLTFFRINSLSLSYSYEEEFYKSLFRRTQRFHNYAEVVAIAKMQKINVCGTNQNERWIQLGLNPIGDPEMPVYTQAPIEFDSCAVSYIDSCIIVNAGTDSCTICVMSTADNGATYYDVRNYVSSAVFPNINGEVSVCVTKHNHVPKIVIAGPVINIQNENILDSRTYVADRVNVGTHVTDEKPIGNVVLEGGTTQIKGKSVKLMSGTLVKKGAQLKINNNN